MKESTEPKGINVAEFNVFSKSRIHLFESKAGFEAHKEMGIPTRTTATGPAPAQIINLTAFMQPDGRLDWDAPAGNWDIVRFGYSLTGKKITRLRRKRPDWRSTN